MQNRFQPIIFFGFIAALLTAPVHAQNWRGILKPTSGSGACSLSPKDAPAGCAIDWSQSGLPVGFSSASWAQSGSTIQASTYGNGSSDATPAIQAALKSCSGSKYVLLSAGTFRINSSISIPSNCELRGAGADQTILNTHGNSVAPVVLGGGSPSLSGKLSITSGATAGSTSLTLGNTNGVTAGGYLVVTDTNDPWVTIHGGEGDCNWCDGWSSTGSYTRGQIVEVQSIAGNVVTISPGLYTAYPSSPFVVPFAASAKYAGARNLQIYMNDSGYTNGFYMEQCAYCWVQGTEVNYADGNFVEDAWGYRDAIQNNYFSNAYNHNPGGTDADIFIDFKTSASQIVNNIVERGHSSIMLNWGAAGNVVAYNYTEGEFASGNANFTIGGIVMHGAHPQFNLIEGNVSDIYQPDEIWGSSSHNTNFRNWFEGTTVICSPNTDSGRTAVNCSNAVSPFQASYAENPAHYSWYDNFIGDIAGSARQMNQLAYGTAATSHVPILPWKSGSARIYDYSNYNFTFGFGEISDDGVSGDGCAGSTVTPCHSVDAYETSLIYNSYSYANNKTNCLSGGVSSSCTTSLPPSFYLSNKPSWWNSNISWPAIGPDVTSGDGPGGHSSLTGSNPAQYCYLVTMKGKEGGAGSPLSFNADRCYPNSTSTASSPDAPTALSGVAH